MPEPDKLPGVRYSLTILAAISREQPVSFGRLLHNCGGWEKSRLSRYLKPLLATGWLRKNGNGDYMAGENYLQAARLVAAGRDVAGCFGGVVDNLAEFTGESAAYVEWARGGGIVFRLKREMPESYHYLAVGAVNPAYWVHPFALLALAYQDEKIREEYINANSGWDEDKRNEWREYLAGIRTAGWIHGRDKIWRLAAPVFCGDGGMFLGVLGISSLEQLHEGQDSAYLKVIKQAAAEATRMAGEYLGNCSN